MPTDVSPTLVSPSGLPQFVKEKNGYIVLNHYFKGNGDVRPFSLSEIDSWLIDGVEIVNGWIDLETEGTTAELRQFCLSTGRACVSGSDEHQNRELRYFMRVQFADSDHLSLAEVFSTLKQNRHQVVAIRYDDPVKFWPTFRIFANVASFINYLWNADRFQIFSWIIWSWCFYIMVVRLNSRLLAKYV